MIAGESEIGRSIDGETVGGARWLRTPRTPAAVGWLTFMAVNYPAKRGQADRRTRGSSIVGRARLRASPSQGGIDNRRPRAANLEHPRGAWRRVGGRAAGSADGSIGAQTQRAPSSVQMGPGKDGTSGAGEQLTFLTAK